MFASTIGFLAACVAPIRYLLRGAAWHAATAACLYTSALALIPFTAVAQQGGISIDAFRILNTTPDFVDIELSGSDDGTMGQLCVGVIAKSTDGMVRSQSYSSIAAPGDAQFRVLSRVMRPSGLARQETDCLMAMVYPCGQGTVLRRKFAWHYAWPEKKAGTSGSENDQVEMSEARPWLAFKANLDEEDFAALDTLIQKWNDPKARDQDGEWKLDGFRSVFLRYSSVNRDWKGDLQRIKRWREFNSKSAGAAIAEAKYWVSYAWHIRGNETTTQADPVALRVFGERMRRAEQVLKDAREFAADNPLWYEAYLDIAAATRRDEKFTEALFNEAIRRHPYFQPLYLGMSRYWAPYSGDTADWKKVDDVIKQAVSNTADMDGTGNYALLYAQISDVQKLEFDLFQDSRVSWEKMRDSFEDLVKRYPSNDNLNEFAAFACRANDKGAFLNIRPKINNRIVPKKWPGNYSCDLCDHRFMQGA